MLTPAEVSARLLVLLLLDLALGLDGFRHHLDALADGRGGRVLAVVLARHPAQRENV